MLIFILAAVMAPCSKRKISVSIYEWGGGWTGLWEGDRIGQVVLPGLRWRMWALCVGASLKLFLL